jgi:hypothetical protein
MPCLTIIGASYPMIEAIARGHAGIYSAYLVGGGFSEDTLDPLYYWIARIEMAAKCDALRTRFDAR